MDSDEWVDKVEAGKKALLEYQKKKKKKGKKKTAKTTGDDSLNECSSYSVSEISSHQTVSKDEGGNGSISQEKTAEDDSLDGVANNSVDEMSSSENLRDIQVNADFTKQPSDADSIFHQHSSEGLPSITGQADSNVGLTATSSRLESQKSPFLPLDSGVSLPMTTPDFDQKSGTNYTPALSLQPFSEPSIHSSFIQSSLPGMYNAETERLKATISDMKSRHQREIDNVKKMHQERLAELQQNAEVNVSAAHKQLAEQQKQHDDAQAALLAALDKEQAVIKSVQQSKEQLAHEVMQLKKKLPEEESKNAQLYAQCQALQQDLASVQSERDLLHLKISEVSNKLDDTLQLRQVDSSKWEEERIHLTRQLETQIKEAEKLSFSDFESQLENLTNQLEEAQQREQQAMLAVDAMRQQHSSEIKALQREAEKKVLNQELQSKKDAEEFENQLNLYRQKIEHLESTKAQEKDSGNLLLEVQQLGQQLAESRSALSVLTEERDLALREKARLVEELQVAMKSRVAASEKSKEYTEKFSFLEDANQELEETNRALLSQMEQLNCRIEESEAKYHVTIEERDTLIRDKEDLEEEKERLLTDMADKQSEVHDLRKSSEELNDEVNRLQNEISMFQSSSKSPLPPKEAEASELLKMLSVRIDSAMKTDLADAGIEATDVQSLISNLSKRVQEKSKEISQLEKYNEQLQESLRKAQKDLQHTHRDVVPYPRESSVETFLSFQSSKSTLEAQVEKERKKLEEKLAEKDEIQAQLQTHEAELIQKQSEKEMLEALLKEKAILEKELMSQKEQLQSSLEEIQSKLMEQEENHEKELTFVQEDLCQKHSAEVNRLEVQHQFNLEANEALLNEQHNEQLKELEETHQSELKSLKESLTSEFSCKIQELQESLDCQKNKALSLEQSHEEQVQLLKKEYSDHLSKQKDELTTTFSEKQALMAKEIKLLEEQRNEIQASSASTEVSLKKDLMESQRSCEEIRNELKEQISEKEAFLAKVQIETSSTKTSLRRECEQQIEELKANHAKQVLILEEKHQEELEKLRTKQELTKQTLHEEVPEMQTLQECLQERENKLKSYQEQMNRMEKDHTETVQSLRGQLDTGEQQVASLQHQLAQAQETLEKEVTTQLSQQEATLRAAYSEERQTAIEKLQTKHNEELADAQKKLLEVNREKIKADESLLHLKNTCKTEAEEYKQLLDEKNALVESYKQAIDSQESKMGSALTSLEATLKSGYESKVQELRDLHAEQLNLLKDQQQRKLEEVQTRLQAEHGDAVQRLVAERDNHLAELLVELKASEAKCSQLKEKCSESMEDIEKREQLIKKELEQKNRELAMLRQDRDAFTKNIDETSEQLATLQSQVHLYETYASRLWHLSVRPNVRRTSHSTSTISEVDGPADPDQPFDLSTYTVDTTLAPGEETAIGNDTTLDLEGQLVHEMTKGNLEDGEQMLQLPTDYGDQLRAVYVFLQNILQEKSRNEATRSSLEDQNTSDVDGLQQLIRDLKQKEKKMMDQLAQAQETLEKEVTAQLSQQEATLRAAYSEDKETALDVLQTKHNEEMADAQKKLLEVKREKIEVDVSMLHLKNTYQSKVDEYKRQLDEKDKAMKRAIDDLIAKHTDQLKLLEEEHQRNLSNQEMTELSQLEQHYKNMLETLGRELAEEQQQVASLQHQLAQAQETLEKEVTAQLSQQEATLRAAYSEERQTAIEELQTKHNEELADAQKKLLEVNKEKIKVDESLLHLKNTYQSEVDEYKRQLDEKDKAMKRANDDLIAQHNDQLKLLEEEHQRNLSEQEMILKESWHSESKKDSSKFNDERQSQAAAVSTLERALEQEKQRSANLEQRNAENIENLREHYSHEQARLSSAYNEARETSLNALKKDHEEEIKSLQERVLELQNQKKQVEEGLSEVKMSLLAEISAYKQQMSEKSAAILSLEKERTKQMSEARNALVDLKSSLESSYERKVAEQRALHEEQLSQIKSQYQEKLDLELAKAEKLASERLSALSKPQVVNHGEDFLATVDTLSRSSEFSIVDTALLSKIMDLASVLRSDAAHVKGLCKFDDRMKSQQSSRDDSVQAASLITALQRLEDILGQFHRDEPEQFSQTSSRDDLLSAIEKLLIAEHDTLSQAATNIKKESPLKTEPLTLQFKEELERLRMVHKADRDNHLNEIKRLRDLLDSLRSEYMQKVKELNSQLLQMSQHMGESPTANTLKQERENLLKELKGIRGMLKQRETEADQLTKLKNQEIKNLEAKLGEEAGSLSRLSSTLHELQEERDQLIKEMQILQNTMAKEKELCVQKLAAAENEAQGLTVKLQEASCGSAELQRYYSEKALSLEQERDQLAQEIEQLHANLMQEKDTSLKVLQAKEKEALKSHKLYKHAENQRRALVFQKTYLTQQVNSFFYTQQAALNILQEMGQVNVAALHSIKPIDSPKQKFRASVWTVIGALRILKLWKRRKLTIRHSEAWEGIHELK